MTVSPPTKNTDRNLLFGVMALQLNFINRNELIGAMNAWVINKTMPLGQILCNQGALSAGPCEMLDAVVDEHVRQHGGDVEASLISATEGTTVSDDIGHISDPDVESTLSGLARRRNKSVPRSRDDSRYCNLRPYARGGLGQVFLADDTELTREVAVKEIQPDRATIRRADRDSCGRPRLPALLSIRGSFRYMASAPIRTVARTTPCDSFGVRA